MESSHAHGLIYEEVVSILTINVNSLVGFIH